VPRGCCERAGQSGVLGELRGGGRIWGAVGGAVGAVGVEMGMERRRRTREKEHLRDLVLC
jgi:hypothetical protein